jgi:hypothetical protein
MGLVPAFVRMLLSSRVQGVSFERTLTLGRQQWYVPPAAQREIADRYGIASPRADEPAYGGFSDAFFRGWLGARELVSLDASDYEGATLLHDLNRPVPCEWHRRFTVVVDGGTLEHIFHFPTALESCMRMVEPGGSLFGFTPANNYCGHGFYQFSPELLYRVFSPASGFRLEQLYLATHPFPGGELSGRLTFHSVRDPAQVRARVGLLNSEPAALVYQAVRERESPVLAPDPVQADYAQAWTGGKCGPAVFHSEGGRRWAAVANRLVWAAAARLPRPLLNWLAGQYQRHWLYHLRNRRFFRRLRPDW